MADAFFNVIDRRHASSGETKHSNLWRLYQFEPKEKKMYYITRASEPIHSHYRTSHYTQSYITPRGQGYTRQFLRYERVPTARTIKASYFVAMVEQQAQRRLARKKAKDSYLSLAAGMETLAGNKDREKEDWVRFFYKPIDLYTNQYKKVGVEKRKEAGYELIELKNPGIYREFLIQEKVTHRLVKWDDLPVANIVLGYLRTNRFPADRYYSEEDFMNDVENESREIFLCVEKRTTAEFILNLCYTLIGWST